MAGTGFSFGSSSTSTPGFSASTSSASQPGFGFSFSNQPAGSSLFGSSPTPAATPPPAPSPFGSSSPIVFGTPFSSPSNFGPQPGFSIFASSASTPGFPFVIPASTSVPSAFPFNTPASSSAFSFGTRASSAATPSFSNPATSNPSFSFGIPTASSASILGFSFATPASSSSTSCLSFGVASQPGSTLGPSFRTSTQPASSPAPLFSIAVAASSSSTPSLPFGTPASSSASTPGLSFGTPASSLSGSSASQPSFGFGNVGSCAATTAASLSGGFGSSTSSTGIKFPLLSPSSAATQSTVVIASASTGMPSSGQQSSSGSSSAGTTGTFPSFSLSSASTASTSASLLFSTASDSSAIATASTTITSQSGFFGVPASRSAQVSFTATSGTTSGYVQEEYTERSLGQIGKEPKIITSPSSSNVVTPVDNYEQRLGHPDGHSLKATRPTQTDSATKATKSMIETLLNQDKILEMMDTKGSTSVQPEDMTMKTLSENPRIISFTKGIIESGSISGTPVFSFFPSEVEKEKVKKIRDLAIAELDNRLDDVEVEVDQMRAKEKVLLKELVEKSKHIPNIPEIAENTPTIEGIRIIALSIIEKFDDLVANDKRVQQDQMQNEVHKELQGLKGLHTSFQRTKVIAYHIHNVLHNWPTCYLEIHNHITKKNQVIFSTMKEMEATTTSDKKQTLVNELHLHKAELEKIKNKETEWYSYAKVFAEQVVRLVENLDTVADTIRQTEKEVQTLLQENEFDCQSTSQGLNKIRKAKEVVEHALFSWTLFEDSLKLRVPDIYETCRNSIPKMVLGIPVLDGEQTTWYTRVELESRPPVLTIEIQNESSKNENQEHHEAYDQFGDKLSNLVKF